MRLIVEATRLTTRNGTDPDDEAYIEQIHAQLILRLKELQFHDFHLRLEWEPE